MNITPTVELHVRQGGRALFLSCDCAGAHACVRQPDWGGDASTASHVAWAPVCTSFAWSWVGREVCTHERRSRGAHCWKWIECDCVEDAKALSLVTLVQAARPTVVVGGGSSLTHSQRLSLVVWGGVGLSGGPHVWLSRTVAKDSVVQSPRRFFSRQLPKQAGLCHPVPNRLALTRSPRLPHLVPNSPYSPSSQRGLRPCGPGHVDG